MQTMLAQYQKLALSMVALATVLHQFVYRFLVPSIEADSSLTPTGVSLLTFFLSMTGVYSAVFVLPMWLYQKWLWRPLNPRLDFKGVWQLVIQYDALERPSAHSPTIPAESEFNGFVTILQSPFALSMVDGSTRPTGDRWHSTSTFIGDDGQVTMSYSLARQPPAGSHLAGQIAGIEYISVDKRSRRGRPTVLRSHFYHAALPDLPLHRGTAVWYRSSERERTKTLAVAGSHPTRGT